MNDNVATIVMAVVILIGMPVGVGIMVWLFGKAFK